MTYTYTKEDIEFARGMAVRMHRHWERTAKEYGRHSSEESMAWQNYQAAQQYYIKISKENNDDVGYSQEV